MGTVETTQEAVLRPADDQTACIVTCEATMDIARAQDLYKTLREALATRQPVIFEAPQVVRMDTAILQVVYAFFQEARAQGLSVSWREPSPAVFQAARLLGLAANLALPTGWIGV